MNFKEYKKTYKKSSKAGFTLVETLVAIAILSLSILSAFTAVQLGLQLSSYSQNKVTAFYLAQESAEFIRNMRDENMIWSTNSVLTGGTARDWLYGISYQTTDPCYFGKTCQIDAPAHSITTCSGSWGTCDYLRQDSSSGFFGYNGAWALTNYKREIQLKKISNTEILATISISWQSGSTQKTLRFEQSFFNR